MKALHHRLEHRKCSQWPKSRRLQESTFQQRSSSPKCNHRDNGSSRQCRQQANHRQQAVLKARGVQRRRQETIGRKQCPRCLEQRMNVWRVGIDIALSMNSQIIRGYITDWQRSSFRATLLKLFPRFSSSIPEDASGWSVMALKGLNLGSTLEPRADIGH